MFNFKGRRLREKRSGEKSLDGCQSVGFVRGVNRLPSCAAKNYGRYGGVFVPGAAPGGVESLSEGAVSPFSSSPLILGEVLMRLFCLEAEGVGPSRESMVRLQG
jgi:hypothetical protein